MTFDNKNLNTAQFSGYIINDPAISYKLSKSDNTKKIPYLPLFRNCDNVSIPCVAIGNLALKLNALLEQGDKVFLHASFRPIYKPDNTFVFRFLISFIAILEKKNASLSFSQDSNSLDLLTLLDS